LSKATTLEALDRLAASVAGLVALVPKSHPAPTVFQQSVRIELEAVMGSDAAAASLGNDAMPDMAAVLACAAEERQKREAVLVQSSTRLSSAYRGYRGRLRLRGTALARLSCIVLTECTLACSDLMLARLEWRLQGCVDRIPPHADVVDVYLQTVNAEYSFVDSQGLSAEGPCPPFRAPSEVIAHAGVLRNHRLAELVRAKTMLWKAFKGYKTGVSVASVAIAEMVMNDIRRFETALDRELDVLSARIAKALERVRGKKEAEQLFLQALNNMMAGTR